MIKICKTCKKDFRPFSKQQVYCSRKCFDLVRSKHRRNRVKKNCVVCAQEFETPNYRSTTAKYCSKQCWSNRRKPNIRQCKYCEKEFDTPEKEQSFCSVGCSRQYLTGDNHPNWKGGHAAHRRRGMLKGGLAKWRNDVYERDNYTCRKCGSKKDINAHHTKPLADFPELALDLNNGITVCILCHERIHGRKLSTPGKYPKHCTDCGQQASGKAFRCRSCGIAHSWHLRGARKKRICSQCKKEFIPDRPSYKYCSKDCRIQAKQNHSWVNCDVCSKLIKRKNVHIEKSKTNKWYCSQRCHRNKPSTKVNLICSICKKHFSVKPYRIKENKTICCSKECGYLFRKLPN